ncbi:MAG: glycosyltransferase, partial [Deltaproteobacteria bacterium]
AAGRAVVGSDSGGTPEMIRDRENGFLFKTNDPEDLAQKLAALVQDRELRSRLGASARQVCVRDYSIERNVEAIQSVYARLLGEKDV